MTDVDRPVCFWCVWNGRGINERIVSPVDAVFEAICGHDGCPSVVFHGVCLMEFRSDVRFQEARARNDALIAWLRGDDG